MKKKSVSQKETELQESNRPPKKILFLGFAIVLCLMSLVLYGLIKLFPPLNLTTYKEQFGEEVPTKTKKIREKSGEDAKALLEIADFDWESGEHERAFDMLNEIIANSKITDSNGLAAWARLGMRYNSIGKYKQTIDLYESLFQYIDPHHFKSGE